MESTLCLLSWYGYMWELAKQMSVTLAYPVPSNFWSFSYTLVAHKITIIGIILDLSLDKWVKLNSVAHKTVGDAQIGKTGKHK